MEGKSQRNSKGPVPTPTNKGPEEIQEWNRLLELPVEIGTMNFEKRTRELLISEEKWKEKSGNGGENGEGGVSLPEELSVHDFNPPTRTGCFFVAAFGFGTNLSD